MAKDYYKTLGVEKGASKDDLKKAFHKLAHKYHPDKSGGDEAKFKEVNEAYEVLSDGQKKAAYDRFGHAGVGAGGAAGYGGGGAGGVVLAPAGGSGFMMLTGGMEAALGKSIGLVTTVGTARPAFAGVPAADAFAAPCSVQLAA